MDENGETVEINGGTLKAGTVEADDVVAGISISSPNITGGEIHGTDIYGGKFWNSDANSFIKMIGNETGSLTRLLLCTEQHDESNPFFEINAEDPAVSAWAKEIDFQILNDIFLRAIWQSSANPNVVITSNTFNVIGDVVLTNSYGSSLPSSGSEGQIFFVVS